MKPPNIIYIHSHDTGRYIQPYGYAVDTPHLQRLAEQGVLFRQAFCAAPTCSPSRAALLTGQSPHSVGMLGLAHRGHRLNDYHDHIIHTLHRAGYTSALAGTQHIAHPPAHEKGVGVIGYERLLKPEHEGDVVDEAVKFIHESHDKPFFLTVGFVMTHRAGRDDHGNQWHNATGKPRGDSRYVRPPAPLPDNETTRVDFAEYGVCVNELDRAMGRVFDAVDAAGLVDNTLIIATTDHGIAFPAMKCNLTDHGMGVMLILRGPASMGLTGGKVVDGMVSQIDLFPTICELVDIDPPARLEGKSIMPLVRGEAQQVNEEVFGEVTHHAAYEPKRAVRTTRWKYIRRFDDYPRALMTNCDNSVSKRLWFDHGWLEQPVPREYLFDLVFDPNEACNLAESPAHAQVLEEMRGRLAAWQQRTDDPILKGPLDKLPGLRVTPQDAYSPDGDKAKA